MPALLLGLILTAGLSATAGPTERVIPLGSLEPGCRMEKRWVGAIPALPWGIFLKCGSTSVLVTHPLNLLEHVKIQSPESALEYVRFFSNADTYDLFQLGGMVEVVPSRGPGEKRFNELDEAIFVKRLQPTVAKALPSLTAPGSTQEEGCCRGRQFEVRRVVLLPDGSVCGIVEIVFEDGFYSIASRETLIKDGGTIGLQYFWSQ
jgi:hypothetical protein